MEKKRESEEGLGQELESLLAKVKPPKAPAWFAAKTLARLREEELGRQPKGRAWWIGWRWVWAAGAAALVAGWILMERPKAGIEISDVEVFAGLDALVQQDEENRWWSGL